MRILTILLVLMGCIPCLAHSAATQGTVIKGPGFAGVICSPAILQQSGLFFNAMGLDDIWTPSAELILRAERELPAEVRKLTRAPRRINPSSYWTAKNATSLNLVDHTPDLLPTHGTDADFVYDVAPHLAKYSRQYIGATVDGRKILLMNFIYDPGHAHLPDWKEDWAVFLSGAGDSSWTVVYDPATGGFSDWESND